MITRLYMLVVPMDDGRPMPLAFNEIRDVLEIDFADSLMSDGIIVDIQTEHLAPIRLGCAVGELAMFVLDYPAETMH